MTSDLQAILESNRLYRQCLADPTERRLAPLAFACVPRPALAAAEGGGDSGLVFADEEEGGDFAQAAGF
jgi:hypothetical protein